MVRGNAMAREDRIRLLLSINDATGMPRAQPGTDSAPWPADGRLVAMFGPGACPLHEGLACPVERRRWRRQPVGCGSGQWAPSPRVATGNLRAVEDRQATGPTAAGEMRASP